jgi:hypothetical protein
MMEKMATLSKKAEVQYKEGKYRKAKLQSI